MEELKCPKCNGVNVKDQEDGIFACIVCGYAAAVEKFIDIGKTEDKVKQELATQNGCPVCLGKELIEYLGGTCVRTFIEFKEDGLENGNPEIKDSELCEYECSNCGRDSLEWNDIKADQRDPDAWVEERMEFSRENPEDEKNV